MYSTDQKSPPAFGNQAPATGIPGTSSDQQQTYPKPARGTGKVPWSSGLCDCFSDVPNFCITCWCPCITFGQIADIIDRGQTSCKVSAALYALLALSTGCACIYSFTYRSRMRSQYSLEETPCADCCVHFWCETCALCQEYRELKNRGYDMTHGWHGSMQRMQGREVMPTAPTMESGMQR